MEEMEVIEDVVEKSKDKGQSGQPKVLTILVFFRNH